MSSSLARAMSIACAVVACQGRAPAPYPAAPPAASKVGPSEPATVAPPPGAELEKSPGPAGVAARKRNPRAFRVAHVFVALCDNENQGIVPVPAIVGNGKDPEHNLYWGASFGVKKFFGRSPNWEEIGDIAAPPLAGVLRRAVFRTRGGLAPVYLVADAYDGAFMKDALATFLDAAAGENENDVVAGGETLQAGGLADLVAFVGHNGLMDMDLSTVSPKARSATSGDQPAAAVVLACMSHKYFALPLASAACSPLITTSSLMAPEAYSLDAIVRSWAAGDRPAVTRNKAGEAYARYQRIAVSAGRGVFVAGP